MIHLSRWLFFLLIALYFAIVTASVIIVLRENRNPIRALAWVIALIFLPGIGLIFYLFFGRSLKGMQMISRHAKRKLKQSQGSSKGKPVNSEIRKDFESLVRLGEELSKSPYTENNEIEIFITGKEKFEHLKNDLRNAKRSILLQYYIFLDDQIGNEIAEILIKKAREGLEVKVIYDHVGSFSARNRFFRKMAEGGVEVHPFFRVNFPQFANRVNWRNHRKIVVIDSEIAYIGGMNIADRYVYGTLPKNKRVSDPEEGNWRDTHFRVRGDIVSSLIYSFTVDWNFLKKENLYIPSLKPVNEEIRNNRGMQLVTAGPTDVWNNLTLMYLNAISRAKKRIWIQTPYFLPTDALLNALHSAAIAGLDVRIMIPRKTDSKLLHYASFSYITECLKSGIKIYLYKKHMLHAKTLIIDDEIVSAGSTNFDFRSFENNFECNLFIYDRELNARMREIFHEDLEDCDKIKREKWRKRPLSQRFLESLLRLISPIL